MKLLKVRKAFLIRLTLLTVYLTVIIALVYHLFIPDRYFLWFPAIPVYYYLCGLFYVFMFETSYRMGEKKLITAFLVCKVSKFKRYLLPALTDGSFPLTTSRRRAVMVNALSGSVSLIVSYACFSVRMGGNLVSLLRSPPLPVLR